MTMIKEDSNKVINDFQFKKFLIKQDQCAMKVGTDGIMLGAWASLENVNSILDVGTGTGLIAIMMAQRNEKATIAGVEIEEKSFNQAKENMESSPWADRLNAHHCSIQDFTKSHTEKYDLIVCNPPFFTGGTLSSNSNRNNVRHTVKLPNGELLRSVQVLLKDNGKFCVILPLIEGLRFKEMAQQYKLYCTQIMEVKPKQDKPIERLMLQFEKTPCENVNKNTLIIQHEARNNYTDEFITLTSDFYISM